MTKTSAPDYNNFIPAADEMHLDKIEKKAKQGTYQNGADFLVDVQKIAHNAAVYNTPGNGRYGGPGQNLLILIPPQFILALLYHARLRI